MEPNGAVVVVTGGARGIGRATAAAFVAAGARVAILDRDAVAVEATGRALGVSAHAVDITDFTALSAVIDEVARALGPVDVLVNNAGVMALGEVLAVPLAHDRLQLDVNVLGTIHGIRAVLPGMRARGRGAIVNVASVAGVAGIPYAASYVASKHAVVGLSEALRQELRGTGVRVSTILPAIVETELVAGVRRAPLVPRLRPEQVAAAVVAAARDGTPEVFLPRWTRIARVLPAVLPRPLWEALGRWFGLDAQFQGVDAERRAAYDARMR